MAYVALGALAVVCGLIVVAVLRSKSAAALCQTCGARVERWDTMCEECRMRQRAYRPRRVK